MVLPDFFDAAYNVEALKENSQNASKHDENLKDIRPYNGLNPAQGSVNGRANAQK